MTSAWLRRFSLGSFCISLPGHGFCKVDGILRCNIGSEKGPHRTSYRLLHHPLSLLKRAFILLLYAVRWWTTYSLASETTQIQSNQASTTYLPHNRPLCTAIVRQRRHCPCIRASGSQRHSRTLSWSEYCSKPQRSSSDSVSLMIQFTDDGIVHCSRRYHNFRGATGCTAEHIQRRL